MLTYTVSRQQREVLHPDRNKKLLIKETKRVGGERVLGGAGPSKGSVSQIEESSVSAAAGTQGNKGKGAARKDKRQKAT